MIFVRLSWRDPLEDVADRAGGGIIEDAIRAFERATEVLKPWPCAGLNDPDLPLPHRIFGRFAARGDRVLHLARDLSTAIAETHHH